MTKCLTCEDDLNQILSIAMEIGNAILQCGGEVRRVEDGELLVTAGVMVSKKEEGAFWVAFPPALVFTDGRYTLLPVCCLGNCDKGPTLMIDDDTYGPVAPAEVPALLERYT